jgi:hypothetical protein
VPSKLKAISAVPSAGFGIGFVVNKRLNDNSDVRFTPTLVFNDRILKYQYDNSANDMEKKRRQRWLNFRWA